MSARLLMPSLRTPVKDLAGLIQLARRGVGGFCVFGGDTTLPGLIATLQEAAPHPLIIASDMEQGAGQQIQGLSWHPPAAALDPDAAEVAGIRTAIEARPYGITMTFAPVVDVLTEARNPIIQGRAFGDPVACAPRFIHGAHRMGLRTCAKHFPGHGATTEDSHDVLPVIDTDLPTMMGREFPPFRACIEAKVDAIMTAHIACPSITGSRTLPATLAPRLLRDILRGQLGFHGLIVSDALLMKGVLKGRTEAEAAAQAIEAGCDMVICPHDTQSVLEALEEVRAGTSEARVAHVANPLPDTLERAARLSVTVAGEAARGHGPYPVHVFDLDGGREDLAGKLGCRRRGLAAVTVIIARGDRAWGGDLTLPDAVLTAARLADRVVLLGPSVLLDDLEEPPRCLVHAPGRDPATLREVRRQLLL